MLTPLEVERFKKDLEAAVFEFSEYQRLFGPRYDHIRQVTSPSFFARARHHYVTAVILHIVRLTDPVESGRGKKVQRNLTVNSVLNGTTDQECIRLGGEVEDQSKQFKKVRHKLIAHRDLEHALKGGGLPLAQFDSAAREILKKIWRILELVAPQHTIEVHGFEELMAINHDPVTHLIWFLREGKTLGEVFDANGGYSAMERLPDWFRESWRNTPTSQSLPNGA